MRSNLADAGRLHFRKTREGRRRDAGLARSTGNVCGAQILQAIPVADYNERILGWRTLSQ
jgi:hypothetical protein